MRADYFRILFRKTKRGIYFTSACLDENRGERFHIAYIGQGAQPLERDKYPLDLLVVGDWQPDTISLAKEFIRDRDVNTVILPPEGDAYQGMGLYCREYGVKEVIIVSESYAICRGRWELRFCALPALDKGKALVMYQGFVGDDLQEEDCVLTCKHMAGEHCAPCLYGEEDYCGFGCLRARDYDVLNRHKGSDRTFYRIGALVLGDVSMKEQKQELREMLRDVFKRIRCVYLPAHVTMETYDEEFVKNMGEEDTLYVIGQELGCSREVAGDLSMNCPHVKVQMVGMKYGFCASGYRIPFLREKTVKNV